MGSQPKRQVMLAPEEVLGASVLALEDQDRQKLLAWVPVIKDTIEKAQRGPTYESARADDGHCIGLRALVALSHGSSASSSAVQS